MKKGNNFFYRKGDALFQFWKDMQVMHMSITIHESKLVNSGKKGKDWGGNKEA
jgi:hypothetical protein